MIRNIIKRRKKFAVSILLGLIGFAINMLPLQVFKFNGLSVNILLGLFFPLFISLVWGWKYGLVSALTGGCSAIVIVWYTDGYGLLYSVPFLFLWVAVHGVFANLRAKREKVRWYYNMYVVELVFQIVNIVGYILVFSWLLSLNPPPWDPTLTATEVCADWYTIGIFKQIVTGALLLFISDLLLSIKSVRQWFGTKHSHFEGYGIIVSSILIGVLLIILDSLGCTLFEPGNEMFFLRELLDFDSEHIFFRGTILITCFVYGIILFFMHTRTKHQKSLLEGSFEAIEKKNMALMESQIDLFESRQELRTYIDKAPYGIFMTDQEGVIGDCNEQAMTMTGYTNKELMLTSIKDITMPKDQKHVAQHFKYMADQKLGFVISAKIKIVTKKGMTRDWAVKTARMKHQRCLVFAEDITDRELYRRRMDYLAKYDTITGLYNKNYLNLFMERLLRERDSLPISFMYSDINGLRRMNEQHGYEYGDRIICAVAKVLADSIGDIGTVFRAGGDSFAIVLPSVNNRQASALLTKVKKAIEKAKTDGESLSIALGCATYEDREDKWQNTLRLAENRMYASKIIQEDSLRSIVMNSFMMALAARSNETEEHVQRMKELAERTAFSMGLGQDEIDNVVMAAQFHDIGKMGIPDNILFKPDKLTDGEWIIMKKHCEIGHRIVSAAAEMGNIANYVLSHHERWDGSGYPNQLKGEDIPIESRIVAVADAFDAMTNERVYKEKYDIEVAVTEIKRCSGSQFDPKVVEAFLDVLKKGQAD